LARHEQTDIVFLAGPIQADEGGVSTADFMTCVPFGVVNALGSGVAKAF
jgi:hypothetical protein